MFSITAATPLLARCTRSDSTAVISYVTPQLLTTTVQHQADGTFVRSFSGRAAPQNLEFVDTETGTRIRARTARSRSIRSVSSGLAATR